MLGLSKELLDESKQFVGPLNMKLAQSLMIVLKQAITTTETVRQSVSEQLAEYMNQELTETRVNFLNRDDLLLFLSEHFEAVPIVIETCNHARKELGEEAELSLHLHKERDQSGYCSVVLIIKHPDRSQQMLDKIRNITEPFEDGFIETRINFYATPDFI